MSSQVDIGDMLQQLKGLLVSVDPGTVPDTAGTPSEMDYVTDNPQGYVSSDVGQALNDLRTNLLNLSSPETQELWKQEAETAAAQEKALKEAEAAAKAAARAKKATPAQKAAVIRTMSLSDLRSAFRSDIITEDELRVELASRGYDSTSIETMILLDRQKMAAAKPSTTPAEQVAQLTTTVEKSTATAAKKILLGRIAITEKEEEEELQALKHLSLRMSYGMLNEIPNETQADVIKVLSDEAKDLFTLYKDIKTVLGEVK